MAAETTSNCGGGGGRDSYSVGFLFLSEARVFLGRLLWWCLVDLNCGVVAATTCKVPLLPPARDTPLPQDLPLTNALVKLMVCSVSPGPSLSRVFNRRPLERSLCFVFSFRIESLFSFFSFSWLSASSTFPEILGRESGGQAARPVTSSGGLPTLLSSIGRSSRDADLGSARHVLPVDVLVVDSRVVREASEIETAGEPGTTKTHSSGAVLGSGRR